jgi:hypothetical protein
MTTAAEKLGLKPGRTGWVIGGALEGFLEARPPAPDVILAFVPDQAALHAALAQVQPHYVRGRALWFAYPKKSGAIRTDLTRDVGWAPVQDAGLLPVSQISIDAGWTALRLRYRDEIARLTRKADWPGAA